MIQQLLNPWYLFKGVENLCPHKNLHMDVYNSFIPNCQNLAKCPFNRLTDKLTVVHPDNGILLSNKKKRTNKSQKEMKEP